MSIYKSTVTLDNDCNYKDLFISDRGKVKLAGIGRKCYINTDKDVDIKGNVEDCYILNSGITVEKKIRSLKLINSNDITIDDIYINGSYDINNCKNMKFVNT